MAESLPFKRVCVYCGSNAGHRPLFTQAATELGRMLADAGTEVVYGGGRNGLMGALADSALKAGGHVIGVMPQALVDMEVAHTGLTQLHIVGSMHERKTMMTKLADAFLILPGGWGTLDEMCEVLTWAQLGIHRKPCGLLNVDGYYDSFLAFLKRAAGDGLLKEKDRERLMVGTELPGLLETMRNYKPVMEAIPAKLRP